MRTFAILSLGSLLFGGAAYAQFGSNLVMNGDAEAGPASSDLNRPVNTIPFWNISRNPDVAPWGADGRLSKDNAPGPLNRGKNYFVGGPANSLSSLSQDIDVSAGATGVDAGTAVYTAAAYLGGIASDRATAAMTVTFFAAGGTALKTVTLGPVNVQDDAKVGGLYYRRQIGLVPASTRRINVTLTFTGGDNSYNYGAADNVSLVLNTPGAAQSVLGANLIQNGDAEAGPAGNSDQTIALDTPGWVRTGQFDVEQYSAGGQFSPFAPGPPNRGKNYFTGGPGSALSTGAQDVDVSAASSVIDTGTVLFNASAWLGGNGGDHDTATLSIQFQNWSGNVLGSAQLGPVTADDRNGATSLLQRTQNGNVPSGTRVIHIVLTMTRHDGDYNDGYADNLSLSLGTPARPAINANGIVTATDFGGASTIAPGTWIEIYGANMSQTTRQWALSDFTQNGTQAPTSLAGVSVTVGGLPAYVDYVSLNQVNALVPSNLGTGPVQLTVTNSLGTSDSQTVTVRPLQPGLLAPAAFRINGKQYVEAVLPDGAYVAPSGALSGVNARPAKPGDTVILYGVGFGPVSPNVPAGTVTNNMTMLASPLQILFNNVPGGLTYQGLAPGFTGLYQFNVVVPDVPDNDAVPVSFSVGGVGGTQTLYIAIHH